MTEKTITTTTSGAKIQVVISEPVIGRLTYVYFKLSKQTNKRMRSYKYLLIKENKFMKNV